MNKGRKVENVQKVANFLNKIVQVTEHTKNLQIVYSIFYFSELKTKSPILYVTVINSFCLKYLLGITN